MNLLRSLRSTSDLAFFLRYLLLFTMLFLALASMGLRGVLVEQANPFFYAGF
jgi:hypothetical protein